MPIIVVATVVMRTYAICLSVFLKTTWSWSCTLRVSTTRNEQLKSLNSPKIIFTHFRNASVHKPYICILTLGSFLVKKSSSFSSYPDAMVFRLVIYGWSLVGWLAVHLGHIYRMNDASLCVTVFPSPATPIKRVLRRLLTIYRYIASLA